MMCDLSEEVVTAQNTVGTFPRGFSQKTGFAYPLVRADDLVTLNYGKGLVEKKRTPGKIPVYGTNGKCGWHNEGLAKGPGVILGRKGMGPLGVEWCESDFWVIDTAYYVTPNRPDLDLKFFYYLIKYIRLNHLKDGTSNPSLSRDTFSAQLLPFPPLDEQKAIAHILGTLDDKIELNQQMNRTLEGIARALFKSWFIDFDPVRAKLDGRQPAGMDAETAALFPAEFEDSAIGQIPKGWKVGTINDATSLIIDHRGKTPTKLGGDWSEDGVPALSAKNIKSGRLIRNDAIRYVDQDLFARWMKNPLVVRDILMTSEAPMGELLYLACNAHYCLSQRLYGIRANSQKCQPAYLFYTLASDDTQARLAGRATGTTVQGIRQSELRRVEILLPELAIQKKFSSIADPSLIQIHSNEDQNYELVSIRDALLPKLLSGEIRVKDAEKFVEEVV